MTRFPFLRGAALACALRGAVAGTAIGSTPILDRSVLAAYYQSHDAGAVEARRRALPDHYPLVTPQGTVPVAALAERGLFSQARYRALDAPFGDAPASFDPASQEPPAAQPGLQLAEPAGREALAVAPAPAQDAPAPLALADAPALVGDEGRAKLIDVRAELALR